MTGPFAATVREEGEENGDRLDWFDPFSPDLVVLFKPVVLRLGLGLSGDEGSVLSRFRRRMLGALGVLCSGDVCRQPASYTQHPVSSNFIASNSCFCAWG